MYDRVALNTKIIFKKQLNLKHIETLFSLLTIIHLLKHY